MSAKRNGITRRAPAQRVDGRHGFSGHRACLLNAARGLGLPYKTLHAGRRSVLTLRGGCARLPRRATVVRFEGDDGALASTAGRK